LRDIITEEIRDFVTDHMCQATIRTMWDNPLVGFADAQDPLFEELKEVVRPSHSMPEDLLANAQTVVAYFLPFTKEMVLTNREGHFASKE